MWGTSRLTPSPPGRGQAVGGPGILATSLGEVPGESGLCEEGSNVKKRMSVAGVAALLLAAGGAFAQQPGGKVDATLSSGDVIRGVLVSDDGKTVVIQHPVLGELKLAKENVKSVVAVPDAAPPPPPPPPPPALPPEVKPDPDSFWKGWTGSLEFGLNGSDGNSQSVAMRAAANAKRDMSTMTTLLGISYVYGSQDGDKNLEHGEINARNDWKIGSPWRIFATGKVEYDTFKDWEWRLSAFAGFGYEFIKTDNTLLLGRIGAGASKEFKSSKNRIEPELDIGLDWEHKIDERQKVFVSGDYYPSLHRFTDYRAVIKAGYEVLVDPKNNLSLKLGAEDNYNSNPGPDRKKNDLLYFATIVYNF
jgi:putative salt-induced outer membrane protein YdiY